ncbi:class I adenylate-forming enzyme family protein [Massilia antarctica]|uniref:class I adenylate-forming enzyme family protein n=1 Tax=Massilia antarctica TaxID=2765360 RepID=UPI0006BC6F99|nr:class I adenylate-forming enzyme family protein [Massilia sp. H27-R4]MCY0916050.1 class I adenylate-forming enzyme family protein [Massilia sp. H27-R4]CUI08367.1 Long-chain-fatty-acid--CoA ligase [Janthinobacterium sp. CG23_2]CUU32153.1 Long-chain-fatty-acid--CoA ligase [Janthinobacterium sp. CG23_2]
MEYIHRRAPGTMLTAEALATLRADDSLGSANFFDRCLALSTTRDLPFVYLDRPFGLAGGTPVSELSLDTLQQFRMSLAAWYLERGVGQGDVVAVCVGDGIAPFLHYIALTSIGAAISLINSSMPADIGIAYMQENGFADLVVDARSLATSAFVQRWAASAAAHATIDASAARFQAAAQMPAWWPYQPEDSTLVMLSHTSGTTGLPKAVRFEHRQFFMGKRARIGRFAEGLDERLLTALPQSHSAALSHLETAVLHGIPTYVLGTQDGESVRAAIGMFMPTTVVAFPKSYMLLVEGGVADNEFATVRRWFSMGDAAHQSHTRRLLAGAPASRFIDAFGSSELGMALFRSESTLSGIAPQRSIGRPVDIAVAKILCAKTGEEMAPGEIGLLAVRSPTITSGYWRKPGQTVGAWRGGYFLTGDVAFCKQGDFYQIDREVDVVSTAGGPLYTLLLEEVAQQVAGVCDVSVVGMDAPGGPAILAVVLPEREPGQSLEAIADTVLQALRRAIEARSGHLDEDGVAVAVVRDLAFLPTGATGKVLKRLLRDLGPAILHHAPGQQGALPSVLHVSRRAAAHAAAHETAAMQA